MPPRPQTRLPLDEAEGTHAERRNRLGLALLRVDCDLHLRELVLWIFNKTNGGARGETLDRSVAELAAKPWGLCCSVNTVRRVVKQAVAFGLITAKGTAKTDGGDDCNAYAIDWEGVTAALDLRRRPGSAARRDSAPERLDPAPKLAGGGLQNWEGGTANLGGGDSQFGSAYKEYSGSILLDSNNPPTSVCAPPQWAAAAAALESVGVRAINSTITEAQARGLDAAALLDAVATYRHNAAKFYANGDGETAYAVPFFVREGAWPRSRAPIVAPAAESAAAKSRQQTAAAEQLEAQRRAVEEAAAESRLEDTHGRTLDGLTEEARRAVAGSFQAATPAYARGDWRTPGNPLRSFLLRRLDERGSV